MMLEWLKEHLSWVIIGGLVSVPTLIEISPIKINPWKALFGAIGRAVNGELIEKVDKLQKDFTKHMEETEEDKATMSRQRILRFNDEILQGKRHTKEHFDEILDDITKYEIYCEHHKDYKNSKAVMAIENCKRTYEHCCEEKSFL